MRPADSLAAAMLASYVKGADRESTCGLCYTQSHATKDHPVPKRTQICGPCWRKQCDGTPCGDAWCDHDCVNANGGGR